MNKFCKFLSSNAVEKQINMKEHIYSFSNDYSIAHLSDLIMEAERSTPLRVSKRARVFMMDKCVVKQDKRIYTKRRRRPAVEFANTLMGNKLGVPSHTLLGVKYLPMQKHSTGVFERIHGHTLTERIKENPESGINPMLRILHESLLKGLFFSDLHTGNIYYDERGGCYRLIDFEYVAKLNTNTGMGLALQMGGISNLGLMTDASIYIPTVIDYLRIHFGDQPQHISAFLYFYGNLLHTKSLSKNDARILSKMATLNRPDMFTTLPDFH